MSDEDSKPPKLNKLGYPRGGRPSNAERAKEGYQKPVNKGGRPAGSKTKKSIMIATKSQRFIKNVFAQAAVEGENQIKWSTLAAQLTVKPRAVMPMLDIPDFTGETPKDYCLELVRLMMVGRLAPDVCNEALKAVTAVSSLIEISELEAAVDAILKDRDNLSLIVDNTADNEPLSVKRTVKPTHRQVSV